MEIICGVKVTSFNLVSSVSFGVTLSSYRDYHYKFLVFASNHGAEEEQQYIEYPDQKKVCQMHNPDSKFIRTEVQFIPVKLTVIDHYRE